ncbi:MAG: acyltransferase, partial [Chthoniobacteraceae bacterium]|nr:acyltransferase [Chthoniobacteraceae bacterium]
MPPPLTQPGPPALLTPGGRIAFLDYVRAAAILLVVGFHLLIESFGGLHAMESRLRFADGNWHHFLLAALPFSYGSLGVAVFFFVSGFCIHLSHQKSSLKGYKVFFIRRFFRIYPPYFAALCFFAFLFPMTALKLDSPINFAQFFSHVLMVHNLDPRSFYGINGTFWTLGVEVQLYLIYPVLLLLARRLGWNKALFIAGAIELTLRVYGSAVEAPYWVSASPFAYWFSWAIGARIADDYLAGRPLPLAR